MSMRENHYDWIKEIVAREGTESLGLMVSGSWLRDPKRLAFVLSRYKFVAKLFEGFKNVCEFGSSDGWPSRIVKQSVENLYLIDFDEELLEFGENRQNPKFKMEYIQQDLTQEFFSKLSFDGIYALDVLEHIDKENEHAFMKNIINNLSKNGISVVGIPSLEFQKFSYPDNGHVNCKSGEELRQFMLNYFERVLMFSMTDEVVHTGFMKMSPYLFAVGMYPKPLR